MDNTIRHLLTCKCGWVYYKVSKQNMVDSVNKFNTYYNALPPESQAHFYGLSTYENYTVCDICGSSYKESREYDDNKDACVDGCTISPMLDPSENI